MTFSRRLTSLFVTNLLNKWTGKGVIGRVSSASKAPSCGLHVSSSRPSPSSSTPHYSQEIAKVEAPKKETKSAMSGEIFVEQEGIAFNETFQKIRRDLVGSERSEELAEVLRWLDKVIMYNVPHGKRNRGLALVMAYRRLVPESDLNPDNLELARVLGWCVELLQTFFLVADDIMDQSVTRRGNLCWYRQEGVGLIAINDSLLLEASVYHLLRLNFSHKPYYSQVLDLILTTSRKTMYGQCLDMLSTPPGRKPDFRAFTLERYAAIVKLKTAYYSFSLPIRLAMYLAGIKEEKVHRDVDTVLLKMGHFFQVQDDYLDCFADSQVSGKIGTDIEDGKCCWPVIMALQSASNDQKQVLVENYARNKPEAIQRVRDVYRELDIEGAYGKYEDNSYQEICGLIEEVSKKTTLPASIFSDLLLKIYKRKK